MSQVDVREAVIADARGIAEVHVAAWRAGYAGLIDPEFLAALSVDDRETRWQDILAQAHSPSRTSVAVSHDRIVGWCSVGEARDDEPADQGELWGIYVHPQFWGLGAGKQLLAWAEQDLQQRGCRGAYLWVLSGNERASAFYEHNGWLADGGTKTENRPDLELNELRHRKMFSTGAGQ